MSTQSLIGIYNEDSSIDAIYCHHDGYPEHVGRTLFYHYTDVPKIQSLLEIGPISTLERNVNIPDGLEHTWDKPLQDVVKSYPRDRKDEDYQLLKYRSTRESLREGTDYVYIYDPKAKIWMMFDSTARNEEIPSFIELNAEYLETNSYRVTWHEDVCYEITVKAKTEEEAIDLAMEKISDKYIVNSETNTGSIEVMCEDE